VQEHALHVLANVWTNTSVEELDEVTVFDELTVLDETPLFADDSLVTAPVIKALPEELPTTIYDPPKKRKLLARGSGLLRRDALERRMERLDASMQRLHDQELEQSYMAAMRQFL
jgi:hypothetical protein